MKPPLRMTACDELLVEDDFETRMLNGEQLGDDEHPEIAPWLVERMFKPRRCPFCAVMLKKSQYWWQGKGFESDNMREWFLDSCRNCAYWRYLGRHGMYGSIPASLSWHVLVSKARTFDVEVPEICTQELAVALRRDRSAWALVDPYRLEKLVADVFRANDAHAEVTHVGRPRDGGVDVLYVDSSKSQWLVQVKRRSTRGKESVDTVRNLLGVLYRTAGQPNGIVVSTADAFSAQAKSEAKEAASNRKVTIDLVDRGRLNRLLAPLIPQKPWRAVLDPRELLVRGVLGRLEQQIVGE